MSEKAVDIQSCLVLLILAQECVIENNDLGFKMLHRAEQHLVSRYREAK